MKHPRSFRAIFLAAFCALCIAVLNTACAREPRVA